MREMGHLPTIYLLGEHFFKSYPNLNLLYNYQFNDIAKATLTSETGTQVYAAVILDEYYKGGLIVFF